MGKKREKVRKVVPYSESERNAKVLYFTLQMNELGIGFMLTPELKNKFNDFVINGTTYVDTIDIPKMTRAMEISLINDKHQKTFINLKYIDPDEIESK